MNVSRFAELIDEVDVAARAGEQAAGAARRFLNAVRERVGHSAGRARRPKPGAVGGDVSRHRGEASRPHTILVRERVLVRRIEDAITAAQHHLVAELVGESDAGRELLLRWVALMRRRAVNAGVEQPAFEIQAWRLYGERLVARETDGDVVIALLQTLLEFVAQSEIQGQFRSDAEIVLKITGVVIDVEVVRRTDSDISAGGIAQQEAGQRVLAGGDGGPRVRPLRESGIEEETPTRLAAREQLHADDAEIEAAFERMTADQLRDARVDAMPVKGRVLRVAVAEGVEVVRAVTADAEDRELFVGDGAQEALREAERSRIELVRDVIIEELRIAVAECEDRVGAGRDYVVDRHGMDGAEQLPFRRIARIISQVLAVKTRLRLDRIVPAVETGGRELVRPAMLDLARRLIGAVNQRSRAGSARSDFREKLGDGFRHRVDPVGRNNVESQRIGGGRARRIPELCAREVVLRGTCQWVIDRDAALREVARQFTRRRQFQ